MTREPSAGYTRWYNKDVLHVVDCPTCNSPLEILAADSSGHEIISPCQTCFLDWRQRHQLAATEQILICDECGGKLRKLKDGRKKCMRRKCGMVYL